MSNRIPLVRRPLVPRFSLRLLLLATTILTVWLGLQVRKARDRLAAVQTLRQAGARVTCDFQMPPRGVVTPDNWSPPDSDPRSSWARKLLGDEYFLNVESITFWVGAADDMPPDLSEILARFPELRYLSLSGDHLSDDQLKSIGQLRELEELSIESQRVTDDGLRFLPELKNLTFLYLKGDGVTDASLEYLSGLAKLEILRLNSENITGSGLPHLWNLKNLYRFDYFHTWIQDDALQELWARLPLLDAEF